MFFEHRRKPIFFEEKKKTPKSFDFGVWQRMKDSNPHIQSQSLLCYHYTNPLYLFVVVVHRSEQILLYKKALICQ